MAMEGRAGVHMHEVITCMDEVSADETRIIMLHRDSQG